MPHMIKLSAELDTCGCEAQITKVALDPDGITLVEANATYGKHSISCQGAVPGYKSGIDECATRRHQRNPEQLYLSSLVAHKQCDLCSHVGGHSVQQSGVCGVCGLQLSKDSGSVQAHVLDPFSCIGLFNQSITWLVSELNACDLI